jgi:hypothetical protein
MSKIRLSIFSVILMLGFGHASAQQKTPASTWKFHSINNIGLLEGQTGSAFQLQTINGVQYKSWFAGAGVGLDFYRYRTIPLFADLRKEFGHGANKFFLYADLGIGFSWVTDNEKMAYVTNDHFSNGFYDDFGVGYKISMGKRNAMLISLGYSYKKIVESYNDGIYFGYPPAEGFDYTEQINSYLNRLSIKIGWVF